MASTAIRHDGKCRGWAGSSRASACRLILIGAAPTAYVLNRTMPDRSTPVSTTHSLSSGVAGTMAADGAGLQGATVRNIILAWVLTLPAAIALAGLLYALLLSLVRAAGLG